SMAPCLAASVRMEAIRRPYLRRRSTRLRTQTVDVRTLEIPAINRATRKPPPGCITHLDTRAHGIHQRILGIDDRQSTQREEIRCLSEYSLESCVELLGALCSRSRNRQKQAPLFRFGQVDPQRGSERKSPLAQKL